MLFSLNMLSSPAPPVAAVAARMQQQKQHTTLTLKPNNNINTQISSSSSSPFLIRAASYPKRRRTTSLSLFSRKFSTSTTSPKYLNVNPLTSFWPPSSSNSSSSSSSPPVLLKVRAMKKLQGKVVCATNNKTVAVEVTRLAPHPKYKRRIRYKKKYQAHDPENQFKVGDFVQLESSRPISKTKTFIAVPLSSKKPLLQKPNLEAQLADLPLESASSID